MAEMTEKTKPAAGKPSQAAQKTPFAGRKALISTICEETGTAGYPLQAAYDQLLVAGRSNEQNARELSQLLGAQVSIVSECDLKTFVGQDEADRFIAGVEARKKSR